MAALNDRQRLVESRLGRCAVEELVLCAESLLIEPPQGPGRFRVSSRHPACGASSNPAATPLDRGAQSTQHLPGAAPIYMCVPPASPSNVVATTRGQKYAQKYAIPDPHDWSTSDGSYGLSVDSDRGQT
jgi:hypothetical protein